MASIGLNIARDGSIPVDTIRSLNATWVRIVAMPDLDLSAYFRELRARGIRILLVLARESGGDYNRYQRLYGSLVDAVQVGNEPDLTSPSSWTMTQPELTALGRAVRAIFPRPMPLVCAGLASGHPEWLTGMDLSPFDALAFHPYLKDAPNPGDLEDLADVDALMAGYQAYGKPLLITEWGWWSDAEPRASQETLEMVDWAGAHGELGAFFYFCTSDAMVPPFGLLRADGSEKPRAQAFREAASRATASLWPIGGVEPPAPPAPPTKPDAWQWWDARTIAATIRCPEAAVREHAPRLAEQLWNCGIYEMPIMAAMLGTVAIETAHQFQPIHEFRNADGSIPDIWWTYDGGPEYHGRGFIQLTHRSNYAAYGRKVAELWGAGDAPDFDWMAHPDNALQPDNSAAASALYFRDHGNGAIPVAARAGNWREVRRLVQGGSAGLGDFTLYASTLVSLAAGTQPPPPPADPSAEYLLALKTIRDTTIPAIRAQVDELDRIVKQFAGVD